jgi:3-isopropylmalate dehydratase small subunit
MASFSKIVSHAVVITAENIDTDQIIPARFLKVIDKDGLGKSLFCDWRYLPDGKDNPDFPLNFAASQGAQILLAGDNFGCGSSREHAPWALMDFGIRCVISTSFADIFFNNCFQNGLLPVSVTADELQELMAEAKGGNHVFSVDLQAQTVTAPSGKIVHFDIDPGRKEKMLKGLDAIGETLQRAKEIDVYEMKRALSQPWLEGA